MGSIIMELDTQPGSSAPPAKCLSHLHHTLFPIYLKIDAMQKNIIDISKAGISCTSNEG